MGKPKGRKADFQKIKLKVGRRLPKGLNVTDTTFKSRKIIIREQLLRDETDGVPNRKRGIKEILARLQHYNPGTRHECLMSLKELLSTNPNLVQNHIANLIERVCELMVDKDRVVRKAVLSVLTEILQHVSSDFISPFFPVITSYLCCAMTHIFTDIQKDSLAILDLLLGTFPYQTVTSSSQILKNFLNQISTDKDGTKERVLLVKPGDKMTSQKWRLEVLQRVQKFLTVFLELWECEPENENCTLGGVIEWDGMGSLSIGLLEKGLEPIIADKFCFHDWKQDKAELKNVEHAQEFSQVLLPLLLEIWLEASPDRRPHKTGGNLSHEASDILECVLDVTWSLAQWMQKLPGTATAKKSKNVEWLEQVFYKDFEKFFLKAFPYAALEVTGPKRKAKFNRSQLSLSSHNLTICQIFVALKPVIDEKSSIYYDDIIEFLLNILTVEEVEDQSSVVVATEIVQTVIKNNIHHSVAVILLEKLGWLYKHWPSEVHGRNLIEDFFMEITSSHTYKELLQSPPVTSWLEHLPKDILDSSSNPDRLIELLEKAADLASCRYPAFLQGLLSCDIQIIALLDDLPFSEEDLFRAQRHIVNLICILPTISAQAFRQLAQVLRNPELELRNVDYLLQNLNFRFQTKDEPGFIPSHYLSLIICTQFGVLQHEAGLIQQNYQTSSNWIRLQHYMPEISPFIVVPTDHTMWKRHQHISEKAVRYIWDFPETFQVRTAIFNYVIHVLEQFRYLPAHAASGILSLVAPFIREPDPDDSSYLDKYAQLRFSLFDLALSALSTAAALSLLANDRPSTEQKVAEMIFDMVTDFIVDTECIEHICKMLELHMSSLKGLSEAQGECLGIVISKLLKFEEPESASLSSLAKMLQMLQGLTEGHMSRSKWLNEIIYDFKLKAEMCVDLHIL